MHVSISGLALVGVFAAASLYFHFRGRVRFRLRRQLGDYSTLLAPYNAFACLRAAVPSRAVHDMALFPEAELLRGNWQVIRAEALALLNSGQVVDSDRHDDLVFAAFFKRGWKRFYLHWYGPALPSARAHCPRTVALLAAIPRVRGAMFSLLGPGHKLGKHRDPFAGTLRYHLGLVTPGTPDCRMVVDGEPYVWRDGEHLLFDSSYIHSAVNQTAGPRLILFCDVERPMRDRLSRAINRGVLRYLLPCTQTPNVPGEPVGFGNRVFACIYPIGRAVQALKGKSAAAYYVAKTVVLVGAFVAVLLRW